MAKKRTSEPSTVMNGRATKRVDAVFKAASGKTLRKIHFYDIVPGQAQCWIHYVSDVFRGADCRVLDTVRTLDDLTARTLQLLPDTLDSKYKNPSPALQKAALEEAVRVSLAGPTFLDNVRRRSPFRDSGRWIEDERAKFLDEYQARRSNFRHPGDHAMGQNQQEKSEIYAAKKVIRDLDMVTYVNPPKSVTLNIPRPLIERAMDGQRDWMEACQLVAHVCEPYVRALRPMRFGQVEILGLQPPLPHTLHILIFVQAGEDIFYVNDEPFYPYSGPLSA